MVVKKKKKQAKLKKNRRKIFTLTICNDSQSNFRLAKTNSAVLQISAAFIHVYYAVNTVAETNVIMKRLSGNQTSST